MQDTIERLRKEMACVLIGQERLVDALLIGLLCRGHILVEGVPGLAKTTAVRAFARILGLSFRRIQFTPDLLPADLVGTQVYEPATGAFRLHRGPVFAQVLLADEINRAPAKVQSALLEAMEERQVTLAGETLPLPSPFLVMATQNPLEQEGVYPLPEAQVDRFMLKVRVAYPRQEEEVQIVEQRLEASDARKLDPILDAESVARLQRDVRDVHVDPAIVRYAVELVTASRERAAVALGGSPRASIFLVEGARARACLEGRDFVLPEDVKAVAPEVLRHRIWLHYEAEADGATAEGEIEAILSSVPAP